MDNKGAVKALVSPGTGIPLKSTDKKNVFHDDYSDSDYYMYYNETKGEREPLMSPGNGAPLEPTDKKNVFHDNYSYADYYMYEVNGEMKSLISPSTNTPLQPTDNSNVFYDKYTYQYYYVSLDDIHGRRITPLFIPETGEVAHIEGNELVGNDTGVRFEIAEDGAILTPSEIAFRKIKNRENEILDELMNSGKLQKDTFNNTLSHALREDHKLNELKSEYNGVRAALGLERISSFSEVDNNTHSDVLSSAIEATEGIRIGVIQNRAKEITGFVQNKNKETDKGIDREV